ncbi:MAG: HepT-like ribonuclease domain-containing protein [Dehalococcoidia bacterium]
MEGRTRADLDADDVLVLALTRLLEILGEAARGVSGETRAGHPHVPWAQMTATRDRLIHGYFNVDLDIIWEIVSHDLAPVIDALETITPEEEG